jgi:hypothetical protein
MQFSRAFFLLMSRPVLFGDYLAGEAGDEHAPDTEIVPALVVGPVVYPPPARAQRPPQAGPSSGTSAETKMDTERTPSPSWAPTIAWPTSCASAASRVMVKAGRP